MAQLKDNKWTIEKLNGQRDVSVNISEHGQKVLVYNCTDSVIVIHGKCNSVVIGNSKKTAVVFDAIISSVEVVNSSSIQLQANAALPSVSIDKTHGLTLYVQSAEGRSVEIFTSESTEVNIVTPGKTENDDPREQPIPQQFLTTFKPDGKLHTVPAAHVGV